jgi:hypothetical protein
MRKILKMIQNIEINSRKRSTAIAVNVLSPFPPYRKCESTGQDSQAPINQKLIQAVSD